MTMTVPELATLHSTDGKTTRRFLRSITPKDGQPGKGGRWIIDEDQLDDLRDKYNAAMRTLDHVIHQLKVQEEINHPTNLRKAN